MSNINTQSLDFNSSEQGKDNKIKADFDFYETITKNESKEPQRIILLCHKIWIKSKDGTIRQTEQGEHYKANIENGVISFNKPLKFGSND